MTRKTYDKKRSTEEGLAASILGLLDKDGLMFIKDYIIDNPDDPLVPHFSLLLPKYLAPHVPPSIACPNGCKGDTVSFEFTVLTFLYLFKGGLYDLHARCPVFTCKACGLSYTNHLTEEAKEEVIRQFTSKFQ